MIAPTPPSPWQSRIEHLPGQQERPATDRADDMWPQAWAITGYDAELEVRLVLEHSRRRCQHDVGEQRIFAMKQHRTV